MVDSLPLFDLILTKSQFQSISIQQNDNFTEHLVNERTFLAWTRTSLVTPSSSINDYVKRRLSRHFISKNINSTDDDITLLTNHIRTFDTSSSYNTMKHFSTLTKTQIKVIITVVIIISFIIFIIAIFRFK
ncbi:unnamed protein product [Rotaria sordida]|uniref:DUF202 domain-containing protein n=1 Tax=Rotaria sordida TaxID=392033 RepID=A0A815PY64_9BILA|nr:unnamed protein product [Rotaria sordida]